MLPRTSQAIFYALDAGSHPEPPHLFQGMVRGIEDTKGLSAITP